MVKCAAKNCQNRSSQKTASQRQLEANGKITFHRFPKKNATRNLWLNNMGLTEAALPNEPFLCSSHFTEDAFDRTSVNRIQLRPGSFPMDHTMSKKIESNESTKSEVGAHFDLSRELFKLEEVPADSVEARVLSRKRLFAEEASSDLLEQHQATFSKPSRIKVLADLSKNTNERPYLPKLSSDMINVQHVENFSPKEDAVEEVTSFKKEVVEASASSYIEINARGTSTTRSTSVSPDCFRSPTRPRHVDKETSVSPRLHFNSPRKCQLRDMLKAQSQAHAREVKLLKQKCQRGEKRIASLQHVLSELREKNSLQG